MTDLARIRRFLRSLLTAGSGVWRSPVQARWPTDAHKLRYAWRRSDPDFAEKLIQRFRAAGEGAPAARALSAPGVWAVYRGQVTARVAGRGITLDDAGGVDLDDWLLAVLGIDAWAGGRRRARLVAEVTEPRDRTDPSSGRERLRLLGVAAEQRPQDAGAADLILRALAAYAIPGEAHPQTAVVWAISADSALDGLSPVSWADAGHDPDRLLAIARRDGARAAGEPDPEGPDDLASARDAISGALDRTQEGIGRTEGREGVPVDRAADAGATAPRPAVPDAWLAAIRQALADGPADPDRPDREVREVLARTLTPTGVDRWFELPNRHLKGRTPRDVLADDARAVLRAACDLAFGDG